MVDYFKFIGVNRVTAEVYANQGWGAMCTVPAWDADDKGNLEDVLRRLDAKGGIEFHRRDRRARHVRPGDRRRR